MNVDGKDCINLATFNFLGFVGRKDIEVILRYILNMIYYLYIVDNR